MPQTAVVCCGLLRDVRILLAALHPALQLMQAGTIDRVIWSTWEGEPDKLPEGAAYLERMGIEVIQGRFPDQLAVHGNVFQQMLVMDQALDRLDDDALVLKTRTDVVFSDTAALSALLAADLSPGPELQPDGTATPRIFQQKIWVPFFYPAFPFFIGEQIFMGRAGDLRLLNDYNLFTEAYRITSRPNEGGAHFTSGAAPEIRRYMAPFLPHYPVLREYQFVWPKHCYGTRLLRDVMAFNYGSSFYQEYLALSLFLVHRHFRVGGIAEAHGKATLLRSQGDAITINMQLIQNDTASDLLADRLAFPPPGMTYLPPSYGDRWLGDVLQGTTDPLAGPMVQQPLHRALHAVRDAGRRQAFEAYRQQLWQTADQP